MTIPFRTADIKALNTEDILKPWRWVLGTEVSLIAVTLLGDLFLLNSDGSISWLDSGTGTLEIVADNETTFETALENADNTDIWFGENLVQRMENAGKAVSAGQCYSYIQPPALDGTYEPDNFKVSDVLSHAQTYGAIMQSLQGLPEGTQVILESDE